MTVKEKFDFDLQGHRGARGLRPENTLPAFEEALRIGVTTLEMDVVISRDDQVIVSHDPWFDPDITTLPDGSFLDPADMFQYKIYDMMYEEVAQFDCGKRQHPSFPRQVTVKASKPLLSDVLELGETYSRENKNPKIRYNIETKSTPEGDGILHPGPERFTELLLGVLEEYGVAGRTILQSFDMRTLRHARKSGSPVKLSLLKGRSQSDVKLLFEELGFIPDIYSPDYHAVGKDLVEKCRTLGVAVLPWTVNAKEDMLSVLQKGVDGFITDYPDTAKELQA